MSELRGDNWRILIDDVRRGLRSLPDESVHCVVTSPPYWTLRSYGHYQMSGLWGNLDHFTRPRKHRDRWWLRIRWRSCERGGVFSKCGRSWIGQFGSEPTIELFIQHIVEVFSEVRRVLRDDGTCFCNIGDTYAGGRRGGNPGDSPHVKQKTNRGSVREPTPVPVGLKAKDLCGIPWRVALALQADGWYLRSDIIWAKPNPMPSSVVDRPTTAHEYLFLLSRSARYFYDGESIKESASPNTNHRISKSEIERISEARLAGANTTVGKSPSPKAVEFDGKAKQNKSFQAACCLPAENRNARTVWSIPTQSYTDAHFACVDDETECLTSHGWLRRSEISKGMVAAQYDTETMELSWAEIEDVVSYSVSDLSMVSVERTSLSMLLTQNHRCVICRRHPRTRLVQPPTVVTADELKASHVIPTASKWSDGGDDVVSLELAELLGWYISEGHESKATSAVEIYQSGWANPDHCDRIRYLLSATEAEWKEATYQRNWRGRFASSTSFRITGFAAYRLREMSPQKRIPNESLLWSRGRVAALLKGLVDGDGCRRDDGRWSFVQKNPDTANMVQALAIRCGLSATLSVKSDGMTIVYASEHLSRSLRGTGGNGKPPTIEQYTGIVWCPKLPKGTWVARRKGKPFITGNTFPEELPRRCIKAGTSEYGCCAECAAPYQRIIESERKRTRPGNKTKIKIPSGWDTEPGGHGKFHRQGRSKVPAYNRITGEIVDDGLEKPWREREEIGNRDPGRHVSIKRTVGWEPTCKCNSDKPPIRATVLDPFAGSGTTLAVALQLDRQAIGIELNPDYAALAEKRIRRSMRPQTYRDETKTDDAPLFAGLTKETIDGEK